MVIQKDDKRRILIVLVLALLLTVFVLINTQEYIYAAVIYIVIGLMSITLYNQWANIGRAGKLVGIDDNFIQDALLGFLLALGTIVLGQFVSVIGTLGIPNVQSIASVVGRFVIIVISAPIVEEVFFRGVMLDFFDEKMGDMPFVLANLITAIMFSGYHLVAYGDSLSAASGSFISAALMGFIFGYVRKKQNSLIGAIIYHMSLNAWIGFLSLSVVF